MGMTKHRMTTENGNRICGVGRMRKTMRGGGMGMAAYPLPP
jgi:hypothetical protein